MAKYRKKVNSLFIIIALMSFGGLFLLIGIFGLSISGYEYPIYLNERVIVAVGENDATQYRITGSLKNISDKTVLISELELRAYTSDKKLHAEYKIIDITIEPGEVYKIEVYLSSNGEYTYTFGALHNCVIDDYSFTPLFSEDGITFGTKQNEWTAIIAGSILVIISGIMIYYRTLNKNKGESKNEKR